jgi:glutaredoxin-related protein
MKLFGSDLCPWCLDCKENLDKYGIPYTFVDINASMRNLAIFLKMRDTHPIFTHAKAAHDIGIPALVDEDRKIILNWEDWLRGQDFQVQYRHVKSDGSCSVDEKNC